jgi:hypothetical protein
MKIQDAGMILEEQPGKVSEAVKLFLQGLGHTIVLLKKVNPTPVNPKWMSETLTTSQMTTTGRSVSLSATPIKAAKAELQVNGVSLKAVDVRVVTLFSNWKETDV